MWCFCRAVLLVPLFPVAVSAATFAPLGDLPGGDFVSVAHGVSADGSVVVGQANNSEAFRWTVGEGMVGLGVLPGGGNSIAYGVSADGLTVVGSSSSSGGQRAFRWTGGEGMVDLGVLPGGDFSASIARDVSADGSAVVGESSGFASGQQAFRWTAGGGMVGLGNLPGAILGSGATGVSADGSVVVGFGSSGTEAFRWILATGMVGLGVLPASVYDYSLANDVSADGNAVVGSNVDAEGSEEAARWTPAGGWLGLGVLPGGIGSIAMDASSDGSIVVGDVLTDLEGPDAFYWTASGGMQRLYAVLMAGGATEVAGWTTLEAHAISPDGQWIVGAGTNPDGKSEAFLANVAVPMPDPFTFTDVLDVPFNTVQTSNAVTITGIDAAAGISVTGGTYSIGCTATFVAVPGTIDNNQTVCVRHTSSGAGSTAVNTTLTVGGVSDTFTSQTEAVDTTPEPFAFLDVVDAALGAVQTSNAVTITGINTPASVVIVNPTNGTGEYSIGCTGTFTTATGTISNNETICVRHRNSVLPSTAVNTVLTVGGLVADTFTSTTLPTGTDTTPEPLDFPDGHDVDLDSLIFSDPVTILGIDAPTPISVTGGEYSIGCTGGYTAAAGSINNTQTVCLRQRSSGLPGTATSTVFNVGGVTGTFTTVTAADDGGGGGGGGGALDAGSLMVLGLLFWRLRRPAAANQASAPGEVRATPAG